MVIWQKIIIDGREIIPSIPVEWGLMSVDLYGFAYFLFLGMFLPSDDLDIINFYDAVVFLLQDFEKVSIDTSWTWQSPILAYMQRFYGICKCSALAVVDLLQDTGFTSCKMSHACRREDCGGLLLESIRIWRSEWVSEWVSESYSTALNVTPHFHPGQPAPTHRDSWCSVCHEICWYMWCFGKSHQENNMVQRNLKHKGLSVRAVQLIRERKGASQS